MRNLPARQYDIFIKAFEKAVTAKQKEIAEIEALQVEYICTKQALEESGIVNDAELTLTHGCVFARIVATPQDEIATFSKIVDRACALLHERGNRHAPEAPSPYLTHDRPRIDWDVYAKNGSIYFMVSLPEGGITDCDVRRDERTTKTFRYTATPLTEKVVRLVYTSDEIQF